MVGKKFLSIIPMQRNLTLLDRLSGLLLDTAWDDTGCCPNFRDGGDAPRCDRRATLRIAGQPVNCERAIDSGVRMTVPTLIV